MKLNYKILLILFAFFIPITLTHAEGNWWDKGLDIIKSFDGKSVSNEPTLSEIDQAFKQALQFASEAVVSQLGRIDGFNADPNIHIPLPDELETVRSLLSKIKMSGMVDDLELKLNRAAETATPKAKALFMQTIKEMSFDDVKQIYNGPDDSATRYFQQKMTPALTKEMRPIVDSSLAEVGAVKAYDNVMGQYEDIPFVPDVKANLSNHVIEKGMDGIFYYLAKEEAKIRQDPVKQTTEVLKKVFGAK